MAKRAIHTSICYLLNKREVRTGDTSKRRIFVNNICVIRISDTVSCEVRQILDLNIEIKGSTIKCPKNSEPGVLNTDANTFCARRDKKSKY